MELAPARPVGTAERSEAAIFAQTLESKAKYQKSQPSAAPTTQPSGSKFPRHEFWPCPFNACVTPPTAPANPPLESACAAPAASHKQPCSHPPRTSAGFPTNLAPTMAVHPAPIFRRRLPTNDCIGFAGARASSPWGAVRVIGRGSHNDVTAVMAGSCRSAEKLHRGGEESWS